MKIICILCLLSMIFLVGTTHADTISINFPMEIPKKSIIIDGLSADWEGINPVFTDAQNDSTCGPGSDIKTAYLAYDTQYVYWRIDEYNEKYSEYGRNSGWTIHFSQSDSSNLGDNQTLTNGDIQARVWADLSGGIVWEFDSSIENGFANASFYGSQYGVINKIVEGKIPINLFTSKNFAWINFQYYSPDAAGPPICDDTDLIRSVLEELTTTIRVNTTEGFSPFDVDFEISTNGGTEPYTYYWDFGDGEISTDESPSHIYTSEGNYTATLTVTDSENQTVTETVDIVVSEPESVSSECENYYTEADIEAAREEGRQTCIDDPDSCGIDIGGGYDEGYEAGRKDGYDTGFEAGKATCGNDVCNTATDGGCAILQDNLDISMPCIDVFGKQLPIYLEKSICKDDPFGYYWQLNLE